MATSTLTSTAQPPAVHAETGLPIQRVEVFAVGDLVTTGYGGDGYPGVVVAVEGKGKTLYVRSLSRSDYVLGNVSEGSHANYYDDTTLVVDPAAIERLVALGKGAQGKHLWSDERGASKYVLRVSSQASRPGSIAEEEKVGSLVHRARWAVPNSTGGHISKGARFRQDPHF